MTEAIGANLKIHWKPVVFTTVLAMTLIALSIIKWGSLHFQGIGTIGSTTLLTAGALSLLVMLIIVSCKKEDSSIKKLDSVKETSQKNLPVHSQKDARLLEWVVLNNQYYHYIREETGQEMLIYGQSDALAFQGDYASLSLFGKVPVPKEIIEECLKLPAYKTPEIPSTEIEKYIDALPGGNYSTLFIDPIKGELYMKKSGFFKEDSGLYGRHITLDMLKVRHKNMMMSAKQS